VSRHETLLQLDAELRRVRVELWLLDEEELIGRLKTYLYLLVLEREVNRRLRELDDYGIRDTDT